MTTPNQNTKLEVLLEAVENFSINVASGIVEAARNGALRGVDASRMAETREAARHELRDAFADFLAPSLRVVTEVEHRVGDISKRTSKTN